MQFVNANGGACFIYFVTSISSSFFSNPLFLARMTSIGEEAEKENQYRDSRSANQGGAGGLTAFEDVRVRDVLLGRHLGALRVPESDRSRVRLEPRDRSRLAGLANDVDGLSDADGRRQELVRLVRKRNQESLQRRNATSVSRLANPYVAPKAKERQLTGYMAIVRK